MRDAVAAGGAPGPAADLGCGPGWYSPDLGRRVVAVDSALAMLRIAAEEAPHAQAVQADLRNLPFRSGALAGAFASKSYVHLPQSWVPLALADLHRCLPVGAPAFLEVFTGDAEAIELAGDDFPGRQFSLWPPARFRDVVHGAGFSVEQWTEESDRTTGTGQLLVRLRRAHTLADTVGPDLRLLVCGLNPSVFSADAGVGFARPGNRFWAAAISAGIVDRDRDPAGALRHHGIGMTDLVKRATRRADELDPDEYRAGLARVERLCTWLRPGAVCFVGLAGWRAAVDRRATAGPQEQPFGDVPVYVMPSTSGLNARTPPTELADHLRNALALAGPRVH